MRLILVLFLAFLSTAGYARQYKVGKKQPVYTLRKAIEMALPGDTLLVMPGRYAEGNLTVNKPLYIKGIGWPVLDGNKNVEVLSIKSNDVTIAGLAVIRSGKQTLNDPGGIKVYNARNVTILGNYLNDNYFGIYLQNAAKCTIKNNIVQGYGVDELGIGNAIHCWKCDSIEITGNQVKGHRDGIYFEFVTHSVIWRNLSEANVRYGLHFMFSDQDSYISNTFKNNGAGVAVMFTKKVNMINNTFISNWGDAAYGLLLKEISDSHITGNRFIENTTGIFLEGASRFTIENNIFKGNGWGMKIQASSIDNYIHHNNFLGNTFDVSTNGTLVMNRFENNYWDKYEGYDLNQDNTGDVPFHPLSLFAVITENNPPAILLYQSFMVTLLDRSEKLMPSLTPENFIDEKPLMKMLPL